MRNFAFTGPYSAIISDSCYYVGIYVGVLIEFYLPCIFKLDLVSLFVHVTYSITVFTFIAFIDNVLFSFFIISQSTLWCQFIIEWRQNISWAGVYWVLVCTIALRANMVESNILSNGFSYWLRCFLSQGMKSGRLRCFKYLWRSLLFSHYLFVLVLFVLMLNVYININNYNET